MWCSATATGACGRPRGTPDALRYLYWMHYAEGSLMPPLPLKLVFDRMRTARMPFLA